MDDYKIAFIFGSDKQDANIFDGGIKKIGDMKDGYFHSTTLLNFAKEYYSDVGMFKKLTNKHAPEAISYFYTHLFNHAVFLNATKYNEDGSLGKHGKQGIILLPKNLTEKQKNTLMEFFKEIEDFNIRILYNLSIDFGILDGSEISSLSREKPVVVFEKYLEKTNKNKSL